MLMLRCVLVVDIAVVVMCVAVDDGGDGNDIHAVADCVSIVFLLLIFMLIAICDVDDVDCVVDHCVDRGIADVYVVVFILL